MKDLILFGTGDLGRMALHYFRNDSEYRVVGYTDDRQQSGTFQDLPVTPFVELAARYPPTDYELFVAVGYSKMNRARAEVFSRCKRAGYRLATYVSSRCFYESEHQPGENCFILEGNVIQPGVRIGDNSLIWSLNHVGHDVTLGRHCYVSSMCTLAGHVSVADYSFLGINCSILEYRNLGEQTLVGAGAVVQRDTAPKTVILPAQSRTHPRSSDLIQP